MMLKYDAEILMLKYDAEIMLITRHLNSETDA
jgi:hypothetical protein